MPSTSILSRGPRPFPNPNALRRIEEVDGHIATESLVCYEPLFGSYLLPPSARRSMIERHLSHSVWPAPTILDYDDRVAEWHAQKRARQGTLGVAPPLVAALAAAYGLAVATIHARCSRRVAG